MSNLLPTSILIVDDDEMNRDMLSRRLAREGYAVSTAPDGQSALALMAVESYDLVLLDLLMPGIDGFVVLEKIREEPKWKETSVIVLSALQERESVVRCVHLGADDYLVKPFEMITVKSRIWRCLEHRRIRKRLQGVDLPNGVASTKAENVDDVAGATILIVDDEPLNRDLLARRVRQARLIPVCASSGAEAIELLTGGSCDVILLDLMMPEMDGFQVLQRIKGDDNSNHIPVLMLSAVDDVALVQRCLALGAEDFIQKPFNPVDLQYRLPSCIRLKRLREQERAAHRCWGDSA